MTGGRDVREDRVSGRVSGPGFEPGGEGGGGQDAGDIAHCDSRLGGMEAGRSGILVERTAGGGGER